jgi:hypothetical protein
MYMREIKYTIRVHFAGALFDSIVNGRGYGVAHLVEALRCKPDGRGFDSGWSHWNFLVTMALGSTQPLTEMSTRNPS